MKSRRVRKFQSKKIRSRGKARSKSKSKKVQRARRTRKLSRRQSWYQKMSDKVKGYFGPKPPASDADITSTQRNELANYVMKECKHRPDIRVCEDEVRQKPAFRRLFGAIQPKIFF